MKLCLLFLLCLTGLSEVCRAEEPTPAPAVVEAATKVRVACGFEPKHRLKTKDVSAMENLGAVDQSTDFDIVFSLHGTPWDLTPMEFLQRVSEMARRPYSSRLIGLFSVYRWNEDKQVFVFVGNKNFEKAKGFLHGIKDGDYLIFHAQYD